MSAVEIRSSRIACAGLICISGDGSVPHRVTLKLEMKP